MPYSKDNHISATGVRNTFVTCNAIKQVTISRFTPWNMKSYGPAILPEFSKKRAASVFRNVLLFSIEHFTGSTAPTVKANFYFT